MILYSFADLINGGNFLVVAVVNIWSSRCGGVMVVVVQ